jgi:SAM-dependent methyltransferase
MPVAVEDFLSRWQHGEGGQERANYALFLTELCDLIDVPRPQPAGATHERNDYVFERLVTRHDDGADVLGRIDLYKKNSFVLEAKQSRTRGGKKEAEFLSDGGLMQPASGRRGADRAWDVLMMNAKQQAQSYARALPPSHGWPPFLLVCDVGHCIEVYADFSGQGKNYTQFPDRQGFRIYMDNLRDPAIRDRLHAIWTQPAALDPALKSAKVTRSIAKRLAQVSLALEKKKHAPDDVAMFLMRCLFTMFAEDVGLLPQRSFKEILHRCEDRPDTFVPVVTQLWQAMDQGGFAHALQQDVLRFNGAFFKQSRALPLGREEIGELKQAASCSWKDVDPAIFGTLLEQALDPKERKRLGAHYTPRAYVERLVVATVIEPLREDWRNVQAAAETLRANSERFKAAALIETFHDKLCSTRVLDPACGTGNFLYVALELIKRLEGEVLEAFADLGGQEALRELSSHSVGVRQFLGMEINPRAVAIAELVLWIGYLQWHFRTQGGMPNEPILKAFGNIMPMNAVLTWDGAPAVVKARGKELYPDPRRPEWPQAEFIVGNPPFIGKGALLRAALGDAATEALWRAHPHINQSADFVMYWWDRAAESLTAKGTVLRRFGFVTTNSITQMFNRRITERHLTASSPISIIMAIADHPWTKATNDAASVRIAMTVAQAGTHRGVLDVVVRESALQTDAPEIELSQVMGRINSDLSIGSDVTSSIALTANAGLSSNGMMLAGAGFIVTPAEARHLGLGKRKGLDAHIRDYRNGRDLMARSRGLMVIDLFGLTPAAIRADYPEVYQHIATNVKPDRDKNRRIGFRERWWQFGEPRKMLRSFTQHLPRYIATVETTKHRVFQFLDSSILPDHMLIAIGSDDAFHLGVLSSHIHAKVWMPANAGSLGVYIGDVRYTKSRCFDPFPFPDANNIQKHTIRMIAEEIDAHRKRVLAEHGHLTLTGLYNVLDDLRAGLRPDDLSDKHRVIFDDGLVLILKERHERLDAAVAEAYGWPVAISDDEILRRLVALNTARAEEEARGLVRWLRPDYQISRFDTDADKQAAAERGAQVDAPLAEAVGQRRPPFPTGAVEQIAAVFSALASSAGPQDVRAIATHFRKSKTTDKRIADVLWSLARLGHVTTDGDRFLLRRVA